MLSIEYNNSEWGSPIIKPFESLNLSPSASVFHYATECFEGLKAYRDCKDGSLIRLFRPEMNMERFNKSALRLSLPDFDKKELLNCIKELVKLESEWIPEGRGYSLYIRPTMIATNECIGISQPDKAILFVICSPVGPYFQSTGFSGVKILAENSFVRAWPGGTGEFKIGSNYGPTIYPQKLALARGYQQILWLFGTDDEITEIGSMNCFILLKSEQTGEIELVTPPLETGLILPGVTRDSILKITKSWNEFKVSERKIKMSEFIEAHAQGRIIEMFGSGTAAIVNPIKCISFNGKDYEIPMLNDSLAQKLFNFITKIQYGEIDHEWSVKF